VYGALSKEEGECSEVKVPSWHLPIVTPRFYQIFGEIFCFYFACID
jgi:hypothetical protein